MSPRKRTCPPGALSALFVEGGDDEAMVRPLLAGRPVFIQVLGGSTPSLVRDRVRATMNDPSWPRIRRVGVIVDAGDTPNKAFEFAQTVLAVLALPAPTRDAVLHTHAGWTTGTFVVPGDNAHGGSDTLFLRTLPAHQRACVEAFLACTGDPPGTTEQRDKARAWAHSAAIGPERTYKSWRNVDPNHPELAGLRRFLDALVP